jgi:drug/metabolite transporter (DMT)-like permease
METEGTRPQATATLLAVGGIFGSSFLLVKLLVAELSPAEITAWRLLFGGIAVGAMLAARGGLHVPGASLMAKATVLALLDSVIPNTLLAWSQIRIDSSIAAVLISTMPLFTVLLAMALPRSERLSAGRACGLALGIAGVAVLVGAGAHDATSGPPVAHLAVILAAISNAAAVVYARALLAKQDALQLSGLKLILGATIAMTVVGGAHGGGIGVPDMGIGAWCALLALGVVSNGVGRTMYLSLIATAGSVRASLVAYIVPVVGVMLGWLLLGERIGIGAAGGTAMIAAGMAFVTHGAQIAALATRLNPRRAVRCVIALAGAKKCDDAGVRRSIADAAPTIAMRGPNR